MKEVHQRLKYLQAHFRTMTARLLLDVEALEKDLFNRHSISAMVPNFALLSHATIHLQVDQFKNHMKMVMSIHRDIISRYNHGEFFHADSIHFNDSLKYATANGRTVYGGGGIMPDYFVPLDTTLNSHYLNELYTSFSIQEYTFGYAEDHKEQLIRARFRKFP